MNIDGIVLFSKKPGLTSFSSLHSIKKALNTSKVGHTGTLDSFAQGLLVVCTGRLTRLAGNITEFDKTYRAIIKFGEETDTLEYTGNVVKTAPIPHIEGLKQALSAHVGHITQKPPAFSAIHVDGKRASDLARSGNIADIPARNVTVFSAELLDTKLNSNNCVEYALVEFSVSKGTYIRSLARDIAQTCGSAAHLIGLYRTKVGNFKIEDSAGFSESDIKNFTIENSISIMNTLKEKKETLSQKKEKYIPDSKELALQEEIRNKLQNFSKDTAVLCGFSSIYLISEEAEKSFKNGQPLRSKNFNISLHELSCDSFYAVFNKENSFIGLIEKNTEGKVSYKFVLN